MPAVIERPGKGSAGNAMILAAALLSGCERQAVTPAPTPVQAFAERTGVPIAALDELRRQNAKLAESVAAGAGEPARVEQTLAASRAEAERLLRTSELLRARYQETSPGQPRR